jgi:hypothetical protein
MAVQPEVAPNLENYETTSVKTISLQETKGEILSKQWSLLITDD